MRLLIGTTAVGIAFVWMAAMSVNCHDAGAVGKYSKKVEAEIKQVENSLSGAVKFDGSSGDNILDRMAFYKVKGLSIAVVEDYKVVWAKGYGWADENQRQPVTDKTMFMAASVSKSINSMGVMKLVQDKQLDLTKDINDYLVSWKFPYDRVSNGKKITTLNLLTHTAGVNNGAPSYSTKDTVPTILEVLNGTKASQYVYSDPQAARSMMQPDVEFRYSNTGIGITQVMVSDISHKPYAEYMEETVFKPLGMSNSCYTEEDLKAHEGQVATGYTKGYELPGKHVIIPLQAAGGLWTTPTDLARFIVEIQLSSIGKSNKVLSRETVQTMLKPYFHTAPGFFLLEKRTGGQRYFTHSGIITGFKSEYFGSFEGGQGVAVMINSDGNSGEIISEVINSVATVYKWEDFYEPKIVSKKPIEVADELLAASEGVYVFPGEYAVFLNKVDGGHYWTEGKDCKAYFLSDKEFFNVEFPTTKELIKGDGGNVTGIKRLLNGKEFATGRKVTNVDSANFSQWQLVEIGWYLLENKRYDLSLSYFKSSLSFDAHDLMSICNMAHCYLFRGDYENAMQLYRDNLDALVDGSRKFREIVLGDFVFFKQNGFDTAPMDRVIADLNLEPPVGY